MNSNEFGSRQFFFHPHNGTNHESVAEASNRFCADCTSACSSCSKWCWRARAAWILSSFGSRSLTMMYYVSFIGQTSFTDTHHNILNLSFTIIYFTTLSWKETDRTIDQDMALKETTHSNIIKVQKPSNNYKAKIYIAIVDHQTRSGPIVSHVHLQLCP